MVWVWKPEKGIIRPQREVDVALRGFERTLSGRKKEGYRLIFVCVWGKDGLRPERTLIDFETETVPDCRAILEKSPYSLSQAVKGGSDTWFNSSVCVRGLE